MNRAVFFGTLILLFALASTSVCAGLGFQSYTNVSLIFNEDSSHQTYQSVDLVYVARSASNISLSSPADYSFWNFTNMTFQFDLTSFSADYCTLTDNGTVIETNTSITGTTGTFTHEYLEYASHEWNVACCDTNGSCSNSSNGPFTFYVENLTFDIPDQVLTGDSSVNLEDVTSGNWSYVTYAVVEENISLVNCTITDSTLFLDLVTTSSTNANCTISATGQSGRVINSTFTMSLNPIRVNYCTGITGVVLKPSNSTHKMAQPTGQNQTTCTLNVTNNATSTTYFAMRINTTLGWYSTQTLSTFTDLDIERWQAPLATVTNTTWNWTRTCLFLGKSASNYTQGLSAATIRYNFNDSNQPREWYNTSDQNITEYNVTFDCKSQQYINRSANNNTRGSLTMNLAGGYDTFSIKYLYESGSNNSILLEVGSNNGSKNSSWYGLQSSGWQTITLSAGGLNMSAINWYKVWLNETISNSTGKFYLDDLSVMNTTENTGLTIGVNTTTNSSITWLSTTHKNITTIPGMGSEGLWLWYNYSSASKVNPYKFLFEVS